MAKRFCSTEIWDEDWFLDLPNEYKLFWYYVLATCDHAGLFRINVGSFCKLMGVKISPDKALEYFNTGKLRIRAVTSSMWLIEDFFVYQYGHTFNPNNKLHESVSNLYKKHNINVLEVRGLREVKERTERPPKVDFDTPKDKDKEILSTDFRKVGLVPEMMKAFKKAYPFYAEDENNDYPACLNIAYKIAKQKNWMKESVVTSKAAETIQAWEKIIEFSQNDKWYATRSISDFNKEFQRIVQGMVQKNKVVPFKSHESTPSAPSLTILKAE